MDSVAASALVELRQYLDSLGSAQADVDELVKQLSKIWEGLPGSSETDMTPDKLSRLEQPRWEPPHLHFRIERHGGATRGSSRAEIQEWSLNLETGTVKHGTVGHRQIRPRNPPLDIAPLVVSVVELVRTGSKDDPRLKTLGDDRIRIVVGVIIPESSAPKKTIVGRRARFRAALKEALGADGWREIGMPPYVFTRAVEKQSRTIGR